MTRKDLKNTVIYGAIGAGIIAGLFYWARKTQAIPVLSPALIKWDVAQ